MKKGTGKKQMLLNDETERIKARESRQVKSLNGSPITMKVPAIPPVAKTAALPVPKRSPKPKPKPKPQARGVLTQMSAPMDFMEVLRRSQIQQAMEVGAFGPKLGEFLKK